MVLRHENTNHCTGLLLLQLLHANTNHQTTTLCTALGHYWANTTTIENHAVAFYSLGYCNTYKHHLLEYLLAMPLLRIMPEGSGYAQTRQYYVSVNIGNALICKRSASDNSCTYLMRPPIKVLVVQGTALGKLDLDELTEHIKPHINARGTICFEERRQVCCA